ncbi:MAG: DEAD/DEAH box helicase [Muribaculaceae bacterium]
MDISAIKLNNDSLRLHQVEAKNKIFEAWKDYDAVMLQMPTGTGKTYLFTSIVKDLVNSYKAAREEINILIVAHRTELIDQISETLSKFDIPHGFIQGLREQHLWRRVQVGSIMSLLTEKNYLNTQRQKFDYIIVDEAHHSLAETYVSLFSLFPNAKKLGVTATPWRLNHESFLKLYQILIPSRQISWFIQNKVLSDFEYVSIKPTSEIQRLVDKSEVAQTGDFVNAELDNTFNNQRIRSKLYKSYENFAKGRKGIIYAINRLHASKIAELYSSHGVTAVTIDCETPKEERKEMIDRFKKGEIMVLVNVDIFTEGFDCPDVSFIQLARPTKSLALYLQQVGRGLRISEGKEKTIILDNVGMYNYFGLPDANRKWQYHFRGQDDVEPVKTGNIVLSTSEGSEYVLDETKFEEDDEKMMVIRGIFPNLQTNEIKREEEKKEAPMIIEEFSLADYYLIRGHRLRFKVYPFAKKKGKRTESVGNSIYEYNAGENPLIFWKDTSKNKELVEKNIKIHTLLTFSAMLLKIDISNIYDTDKLVQLSKMTIGETVSLFDVLKMLSNIKA